MKCPNCQAPVSDEAAVCPECDHILDPSLFDAEPPGDDAPRAKAAPKPRPSGRPATRPGVKKVARKPGAAPAKRPAGARAEARPARPAEEEAKSTGNAKPDWRATLSQEDWDEHAPKSAPVPSEVQLKPIDTEAMLKDWGSFFHEMSSTDKIAFFGLGGMLLACFFPWKETVREGEVLGVMGMGLLVLALSLVGMGAIVMRVRKMLPKANPTLLWAAQLGAVGLALLWCLVAATSSWDSTTTRATIGNAMVWASKPSFGVIFAFIAGAVGSLGTVLGLKDMNS